MTETLELPNGETVTPDDVFLYNDYPYRFSPVEDEAVAFEFVPLYWGDSELDIPFRSYEDLEDQWEEEGSRGTLAPGEWHDWLIEKRHDDRFGDDELAALREELPTPEEEGVIASIRRTLGLP